MKSIFSIILTSVMLLSVLTACGTNTSKTTGDDARTTPSPAATDMATPGGTSRPDDDMAGDAEKAVDDAGNAVGDVVGGAGDAAGDVGDAVDDMADGVEDAARGDDDNANRSDDKDNAKGTTAGE